MPLRIVSSITPSGRAGRSEGSVTTQTITYNQAALSYNDATTQYGGFYGYDTLVPITQLSSSPIPSIVGYSDIYVTTAVPHGTIMKGQPLGPGFFMYITYPQTITW